MFRCGQTKKIIYVKWFIIDDFFRKMVHHYLLINKIVEMETREIRDKGLTNWAFLYFTILQAYDSNDRANIYIFETIKKFIEIN